MAIGISLGEALYARIGEAVRLERVDRVFGGWSPQVGECHANAEVIARLDPSWAVVHGWLCVGGAGGAIFNAHSIVADQDGKLFDFTPADPLVRDDERWFIRHPGSDDDFERLVIKRKQAQLIFTGSGAARVP